MTDFTPRVELLTTAGPVNITDDVMLVDPITIEFGQSAEESSPSPMRLSLRLKDYTGRYNPRNVESDLYGLIGRNTPITVTIPPNTDAWPSSVIDAFGRTETNGVGTPDEGPDWTLVGSNFTAADFAVSSGAAQLTITDASNWRGLAVGGGYSEDLSDVEFVASATSAVATGAPIELLEFMARWDQGDDYSHHSSVRLEVSTAGAVTVSLRSAVESETEDESVALPSITHVGQALRMRARFSGRMVAARVWEAADPEPDDWTAVWFLDVIPSSHGAAVIRTGRSLGNTNTNLTVAIDDVEVTSRVVRCHAEVQSWPLRIDPAGALPVLDIDAGGPLRRLSTGAETAMSPVSRSTLSRIDAGTGPVAYWPMEDGLTSMSAGQSWSPLTPDTGALTVSSGTTGQSLAGPYPGTAALPQLGNAVARGTVTATTSPTDITMWATFVFGSQVPATAVNAFDGFCGGTARTWRFVVEDSGSGYRRVRLRAFTPTGTSLLDSASSFDLYEGVWRLSLELETNGSGVDYTLAAYEQTASGGFILLSGTIASNTIGPWQGARVDGRTDGADIGIGHITLWDGVVSLFDDLEQFRGFDRETAAERVLRICREQSIPVTASRVYPTTQTLGPQPEGTALDIITDAANVGGYLTEDPGTGGLLLVPREQHYAGEVSAMNLSWTTAGHIPYDTYPTDDRAKFRNRVTVTRTGGGTARREQSTGPLGVQPPPVGVGAVPSTVTLGVETDAQAADQAEWRLAVGLNDEPRIATLVTRLHSATDLIASALRLRPARSLAQIFAMPRLVSTSGEYRALITGRVERIGATTWTLSHTLSPEPLPPFTLESADVGHLDSDASTLDASATAAATSLSVAVSDGTLWSTDAGDYPLVVDIDGEAIIVTAVSGASSPQTFTVAREDGYAVAHAAGAQVRLWRPGRLVL